MPYKQLITPNVRIVEILMFPGVQLLDVTGPIQVFASANELAGHGEPTTNYDIRAVAQQSHVRSSAGLGLVACPLSNKNDPVDTFIVAGGQGVHAACNDKSIVNWVSERAAQARRVVSICSGAFLLGAAGLLNEKRVVTHWKECQSLATQFPRTHLETDPIFINDGRIWTSAGVTAGIDLSLALVEQDLGHGASLEIARDLVVFLKRHGGQAQFSNHLDLQQRHGDFDQLHSWMAGNLMGDLSVSALAARVGMSERSFIRHYNKKTGGTPARSVERMRVEAARAMLMGGRLPVKGIAQICGFGTSETMRRSFLRQIKTTPDAYRTRFSRTRTVNDDYKTR